MRRLALATANDDSPVAVVDPGWDRVLAYRPPAARADVAARLAAHEVTPDQLRQVLSDGGDKLYAAAGSCAAPGWADPLGGPLAVALLAYEVGVHAEHLAERAGDVRSAAVNELLQEYSAVTVAEHLGVSRQAVREISNRGPLATLIERFWRPL